MVYRNDDHGRPWSPRFLMVYHVFSWSTIKYHDKVIVQTMVNRGQPWSTMVKQGLDNDFITSFDGELERNMVYHQKPWSTMVIVLPG